MGTEEDKGSESRCKREKIGQRSGRVCVLFGQCCNDSQVRVGAELSGHWECMVTDLRVPVTYG